MSGSPADPEVRRLRASAAGNKASGNLEAAAAASKTLGLIRVERELAKVVPLLDPAEKARLASLILTGVAS